MLSLSSQRRLCLACRILHHTVPICRPVSTSSAINRGLRATRSEHEPKRGGRDLPRRSIDPPRHLTDRLTGRTGFLRGSLTANAPSRRNSRSDTVRNGRDRTGSRDSGEQRRRSVEQVADAPKFEPRSRTSSQIKSDGEDAPRNVKGGLLREIKSVCKLIQQVQQREAAGEGVDGMTDKLNSSLDNINSLARAGTFREEPSMAIASILEKHAAEGTFVRGERRSSNRSVICQRADGKLMVTVGRGGSEKEDAKDSSSSSSRRIADRSKEARLERPEKGSLSKKSVDRRRSVSTSRGGDEDDEIPVPLPYTTAASEFLYGYNTVLAALKAKRRKLYKLYVHPKIFDREAGAEDVQGRKGGGREERAANEFVTLAKANDVPFRNEFKTKLLDRMSDGRAHNGVLLEASKLPAPPVISLGKPNLRNSTIPVSLARQNVEDADINGVPEAINSVSNTWRHPLIVLLDGITDPGNLGNILRTCHFYGVDAVAVATNTCANLSSAVLAKASSGACEAIRLLSLPQPSNFAYESAKKGWKIYASVAPTPDVHGQPTHLTTGTVAAKSPLAEHPCILMLGAEGEGLRENLRNRADATVSIERGKKIKGTPSVGVDSMNVSVAAGVLIDAFLRKPVDAPEKKDTTSELGW